MALDQSYIKDELRKYIRRELLRNTNYPLQDHDSLINGGFLDSFAVVDLIVFIEEKFGVYIPNEVIDADKMDSLEQMAIFVLEWENHDPL
ncbi:MAG: acyl carrier protein [Chloroflexi bacterium]|nr:acyl carrier protein [Chloroflexota bacterium]MCI0579677.1 acyl carrier protein [Chloroflexota bacterium]MCI0645883.1 acyl carrier protein [Chloroflexota bacterium]MCI0725738.1 acyl carrier protein [Chloroflexota bacterium]